MRWKVKIPPSAGDVRHVVRFAWFPVLIDDQKVWLEKYFETLGFFIYNDGGRWVVLERKLCEIQS
jgi:hypothetical protein